MELFYLTLNQMLVMFSLILLGAFLRKTNVFSENATTVLSKLETYVLIPSLNLYSMMRYCTLVSLRENVSLVFYGLLSILISVVMAYILSALLIRVKGDMTKRYQRNIYRYALAFSNYGFLGNYIVLEIWGEMAFFQYALFTLPIAVLCNTWGLCLMIPAENSDGSVQKIIKKGLLSPPMLSLLVGMILGMCNFGQYLPSFLISSLSNAADCMGPIAMLLAGIVIGGYRFGSLFGDFRGYICIALRLFFLPALVIMILHWLGADQWGRTYALIAFAMPIGMNTIVYPAAYGGETKTGAAMVLISSILAVVTIPMMFLLLRIFN